MADVKAGDREESGFPDGSYPVSTHAQCISAIKLRGHSSKHTASEVLSHVANAARKHGWKDVLALVEEARKADSGKKD